MFILKIRIELAFKITYSVSHQWVKLNGIREVSQNII